MKAAKLFLRFFWRTLVVFLALWALMVGVLLHNSWEWKRRDIRTRLTRVYSSIQDRALEGPLNKGYLSYYCYELSAYGGMIALRAYDKYGVEFSRSQLLAGVVLHDTGYHNGTVDLLFDPVLTEEEQVQMAYGLTEVGDPEQIAPGSFWITGYADITGVLEWDVLYPQRVVLHREGKGDVVLLDLAPERLEGRETVTLENKYVQIYGALLGRGSPEERLEIFRDLEERLDTLEERCQDDRMENGATMLASGTTVRYWGDPTIDYAYYVDPRYPLMGLETVCGLTLLAAVALAAFTAHIQARAVRREREFTRAAAHELKTPLAVLRAHAEALKEDIAPAKRGEYLGVILEESDRMSALVGRLLDLSRLEAGAPLRLEPVDLEKLAGAVFRRLEPVARDKGVSLTLEASPAQVSGDRGRLEEVAEELLTNAIRHCPPGGGVRLRLNREGKRVYLRVENDGEPIPEEVLAHLWEPFFKADPARSRDQGSAGLGLALVRAAAEGHRGACSAANRPGGVEFVVELPALQSQE